MSEDIVVATNYSVMSDPLPSHSLLSEREQARRYCIIAECFAKTPEFLDACEKILRNQAPAQFTINAMGPYTRESALSFLQVSTYTRTAYLEHELNVCEAVGETYISANGRQLVVRLVNPLPK